MSDIETLFETVRAAIAAAEPGANIVKFLPCDLDDGAFEKMLFPESAPNVVNTWGIFLSGVGPWDEDVRGTASGDAYEIGVALFRKYEATADFEKTFAESLVNVRRKLIALKPVGLGNEGGRFAQPEFLRLNNQLVRRTLGKFVFGTFPDEIE